MIESYELLIHDSIKTIINQFHRKSYNFFNEHEFHQYCYHVFYRKKEFSKQYETKDGRKTNILHPEYPTLKKFSRKNITIDPRGKRARYDMAILNPDFINNSKWIFAKTYAATWPHHYIVRERVDAQKKIPVNID